MVPDEPDIARNLTFCLDTGKEMLRLWTLAVGKNAILYYKIRQQSEQNSPLVEASCQRAGGQMTDDSGRGYTVIMIWYVSRRHVVRRRQPDSDVWRKRLPLIWTRWRGTRVYGNTADWIRTGRYSPERLVHGVLYTSIYCYCTGWRKKNANFGTFFAPPCIGVDGSCNICWVCCQCRLGWIVFVLIQNNFSITTHTASMWLTVVLALFRYVVVCRPHSLHPQFATLKRIRQAVAVVVIMSVVLCLPNYVLYGPVSLNDRPGFWIDFNEHVVLAHKVSHWPSQLNELFTKVLQRFALEVIPFTICSRRIIQVICVCVVILFSCLIIILICTKSRLWLDLCMHISNRLVLVVLLLCVFCFYVFSVFIAIMCLLMCVCRILIKITYLLT